MNQPNNKHTVIIANGEFPKHYYPLACIKNSSYIICLDGALQASLNNNIIPDIIIGDGDSISDELKQHYAHSLIIYTDQNTNDLTKSINYCIKRGISEIKIVAATGKREDHTLGNISLLLEYMSKVNVEMITDYGVFTPISSTTKFESMLGQQVSIFNIDDSPITSINLKYSLNKLVLKNWWEGTLNESLGEWFTIDTIGKTIVYRTFEVKQQHSQISI